MLTAIESAVNSFTFIEHLANYVAERLICLRLYTDCYFSTFECRVYQEVTFARATEKVEMYVGFRLALKQVDILAENN
jgi:hypothetical protein